MDPTSIASYLPEPLKPYAGWVVLALMVNVFVIAPSLPVPTETTSGWYRFVFGVLTKLAGNYGNAAPPKN